MLTLMLPALQSCDDNDGYSLGDIAVDWATVRVVGGDTYSLNADRWGTLWPAATAIPFYKPIDGQRVITYFNPLYDNYEGYDHAVKVRGGNLGCKSGKGFYVYNADRTKTPVDEL